jgi:hypothetical protein
MAEPRVFISHSANGDARATGLINTLYQQLRDDKFEVLLDRKSLEIGDRWEHKINSWLGRCHAAIVLFTAKSLKSDYVKYEVGTLLHRWREAQDANRRFDLLPVLLEPLTDEQLKPFFGTINLWEIQRLQPADDDEIINALLQKLRPIKTDLSTTTIDDRLGGSVAAILDKIGDPDFLKDPVAENVGISTKNWTPKRASRELADALVESQMGVICKAISELRSRLDVAQARQLFDLLMPSWVSPAAAERLATLTGRKGARYAALAARTAKFTPSMYLARAKAQARSYATSVLTVVTADLALNLKRDLENRIRSALHARLDVDNPERASALSIVSRSIPATARHVIAVGAVAASSPPIEAAHFSSLGPTRDSREKPEIAAPGVEIVGARGGTAADVATMSGTSLAAAHVSGAIALILSRVAGTGDPWPTATQISAALRQKALFYNGQWDRRVGYGIIDVDSLIAAFL